MAQLFLILLVLSHFDPRMPREADLASKTKPQLVQMYSAACLGFFKRPEFQGYDLPKLVDMILQSATTKTGVAKSLEGGVNSAQLAQIYRKICKGAPELNAFDSLGEEIAEGLNRYRNLRDKLPFVGDLRKVVLQQSSDIVSSDGVVIADISAKEARRRLISIDQLPPLLPKTVVAVEDARFFDHKGIDELGILRALMRELTSGGSRQGASTITQQVARNMFLSPAQTIERKLQEILIAEQIEKQLSKKEILELYLNLIFFGRNSWGIEKAAQSYFGKSAKVLKPVEGAFLVGIIHGPGLYRNRPDRVEQRLRHVIGRMKERGLIGANFELNIKRDLILLPEVDTLNAGYLRDFTVDQLRELNPYWLITGNQQIQSTVDSRLQVIASEALQEGLIRYERASGRYTWSGPLLNIEEVIKRQDDVVQQSANLTKLETEKKSESLFSNLAPAKNGELGGGSDEKGWYKALSSVGLRFSPALARWRLAVFLGPGGRIGLLDGTERELSPASLKWAASIRTGDVVFVQSVERGRLWEVVQAPKVNGGAMIMEVDSGKILAMVGGFSYGLSGYNRSFSAMRQPGSLMKPFTYLAALQKGIQPNYMLSDDPITFPPSARGGKSWTPENYGRERGPVRPMRWAIENSRNVMTAHLMQAIGLNPVRQLTQDFGLYEAPARDYPFILGSQEVNLLSLVKAYAEIANGGSTLRPLIVGNVREATGATTVIVPPVSERIRGVDGISLFQLRYLLQGVVERGTAARLSRYASYMAGKTGTSNDSRDVWFIGFTPHIAIGIYVGYDQPEAMGTQVTGGATALPIFERILTASFRESYLPEIFSKPPPGVVFLPTNRFTGEIQAAPSNDTVLEAYRESALQGSGR